jgi:glycosyltransferase involved in cell wall biosynthesis
LRAAEGVTLVPVPSVEERFFFRALWRVVPPVKLLPDEKWVWIRAASQTACALARADRFHTLVSFGQPWSDHLIGRRVHRATGLPWIAHFSDPWVDSPYLRGRTWQQKIWRRMEADVIREADALIFTNPQTADRVMSKYPAGWRRKAHVIPHGYEKLATTEDTADTGQGIDPSLTSASPGSSMVERIRCGDDRLTIVHTGRFYEGVRTPAPLLHALAALAAHRPLATELHLALVGTPVAAHQRLATSLGLGDVVEFVGRVPYAESEQRAAQADVLMIVDAPSDVSLFLPSKLIDYLPFEKPILALTPARGASADVIRRLGYPVVPPDDVPAIQSAIEQLLNAKRDGRLGAASGHRSVAESYDIRRTTASFAEILARCA